MSTPGPPHRDAALSEHPTPQDWLSLSTWRAFDLDDAGRVLAGSDAGGTVQLVELAPGPGSPLPLPLTDLPGAVSGRYVPGRRAVVVQHDEGGDENGQLSLLELAGTAGPAGPDGLRPLVRAPGVVHRLLDVRADRVWYSTNARNGVDFDVLVATIGPSGARAGGARVLYRGGGHVEAVAVAPDGERLVVTLSSPLAMSSHLVLVDDEGTTPLTDPGDTGRLHRVAWAADGASLVVTTDVETDTTLVARFDLRRRRWTPLVAHDDWDVSGWPSPDGRLLLVETLVDGESRLALHDAVTGSLLHTVHLPGAGTAAAGVVSFPVPDPVWSPQSSSVALSFTSPAVPGDVLLLDAATGSVTAVTTSASPLDGRSPVLPTSHRVPTPDDERVPCFTYPAAGPAAGGAPRSSVLLLHGGPEGQSVRNFNPLVQALAGAGHAVVVPNVRGSTGYGRRWYSLDDGARRLDAVADLAAVHEWLPSLGLDPGRSALWGASYGGYLVLAGLAFQPGRWAAGVDVVGISSLVTFLERTSEYRRAVREREYGHLASDRADLEAASPLTRIDRVVAPLFVVHGANDPRVPLSEAEQLVAALEARGVACELRVYPDEGHGLARRANRLDAYPAAVAFLSHHLSAGTARGAVV